MRIGMRLLLGYFLIVAVAAWFVLSIFVQEIKPGVRRATEGTLIDTATLLAALARDDLLSDTPANGKLAQAFSQLHNRPFRANISGINKVRNEYHVYMTDAQGKVVFDSANQAVGQDYSRWNDVWLPDASWAEQNLSMTLSLNLSGTGDFSVVPVGRNSEMTLTSNWSHPNFLGDFLPAKREISKSGFNAQWQSSWFANNLGERFDGEKIGWEGMPAFSVAVATPADQYQLTDRATKYAILLIVLTFMSFFVLESMTSLRLHPMQYLLVGLSLVMFYLLLLALSEHIGFTAAWITASLVGALMNGVYLQAILQGWRKSILFTVALLGLDGVMWVLLRSQDSSLLLGTGVLLVALCGVMFLTRHLDWHSLAQPKPKLTEIPESQPAQSDEFRLWK